MRPSPPPSPDSPSPSNNVALQNFRGELRAAPGLHPLEATLVILASVVLCFMLWAIGTVHEWSQFTTLGLAVPTFVVALISRKYTGALAPQGPFKLIMWRRLLHFPLFWLGLVFLGYITIQALNPSWEYVTTGRFWWLQAVPHLTWLPTGIAAPFKDMNAWRELLVYSSVWLVGCALWVGITRRSAIQTLLTVAVANGALFAIVGILQRVTKAKQILWSFSPVPGAHYFFSTIVYKNHAGAYLNLVLMICTGLLYWHFSRAERRMERSSPAPVFAFCLVLLGLCVMLTNSRAAMILLMAFTLIAFIGFVVRCALYTSEGRSPWVITMLCGIFALFIGLGAIFLKPGDSLDRLGTLIAAGRNDNSVSSRNIARTATLEMAQDKIFTGWGAGSFRHYFPNYQRKYPEIYLTDGGRTHLRWEYAHNDYVQLLAEMGIMGSLIVAAMLACCLRHAIAMRLWLRPHLMFLTLAVLMTAAHAWVDFQFHNPAILMLWCVTIVLIGRWAELENRRPA